MLAVIPFCASALRAQNIPTTAGTNADPSSVLSDVLNAACRANETQFANFLTSDNAAAFRALPADQRTAFVKRFSLSDQAGSPLISADTQNHIVLRCRTSAGTTEFRFGDARIKENLAFVPVDVPDGENTEFGLVRENGGWKLLSLGLVLLNVPQLSQAWAQQDMRLHEQGAIATMQTLADAINKYHRAFAQMPDTLAQLGPASKGQISLDQASLVGADLAAGDAAGYRYRFRIAPAPDGSDTRFEITAVPDVYGKTGRRSFFMDASGQIHGEDHKGSQATGDDPLLGQSEPH